MCIRATGEPYSFSIHNTAQSESYLVLWKALKKPCELYHKSSMDFVYPYGRWLKDPKAERGSHTSAFHLLPTRESVYELATSSYGNHVMAMLVRAGHYWQEGGAVQAKACWHAD